MKFIAPLLAFAAAVCAQMIYVPVPAKGATLIAGRKTTIEVQLPDFLSSAEQVALAIGVASCGSRPCPAPSDTLGSLLYRGVYNPKLHPGTGITQEYQNFTVTIPSNFQKGPAQINFAHFSLIGAGLSPWLETQDIPVVIQ